MLSDEMLERLLGDASDASSDSSDSDRRDQIEELIQRLIDRLTDQGYVNVAGRPEGQGLRDAAGRADGTTKFHEQDANEASIAVIAATGVQERACAVIGSI